jgi:hypothetical protein
MIRSPIYTGRLSNYPVTNEVRAWFPTEFEQREAARFSGLTWQEFQDLPGTMTVARVLEIDNSKCEVIAHYRIAQRYQAAIADIQHKIARARTRGGKK